MLTRWEVEGELRDLYPSRRVPRRFAPALSPARRYARIAVGVVVGLVLVGAFGTVRWRPAGPPAAAIRQWPTWGVEHVRRYAPDDTPLIPSVRRDRGNAYSARARVAREQVRESTRRSR